MIVFSGDGLPSKVCCVGNSASFFSGFFSRLVKDQSIADGWGEVVVDRCKWIGMFFEGFYIFSFGAPCLVVKMVFFVPNA